ATPPEPPPARRVVRRAVGGRADGARPRRRCHRRPVGPRRCGPRGEGSEMVTLAEAAAGFLSSRRVAVVGVSREPGGQHGGNVVYTRMRERGYDVVAVNPHAD